MNFKDYLLAFVTLTVVAVGCEKDNGGQDGDPKLTATPSTLEFAASGTEMEKTITVTSNREWKIVENLDEIGWIRATVDGKSIAGVKIPASSEPVVVAITVGDNGSYPREQTLTFNGGTKAKATVTIKQEGNTSYNTIQEVIDMYKAQSADSLFLSDVVIKGTVISNVSLDNLGSSKSLYIQDETAGINVFMDANHDLTFGDAVRFNLDGVPVIKYAGVPEITKCPLTAATKLSSGNAVEPISISASDMTTGKYEARYVKIEGVQVAESDLSKTWVMNSSATSVNMETRTGETFVVRSGKYSSYKDEQVAQGSGYICGICTTFNGAAQIIFAQDGDRQNMTGERFGQEESDMEIEPASIEFPASGSAAELTAEVTVSCSRDWKIAQNLAELGWITATVNGESIDGKTVPASSGTVVTITVAANTGIDRAAQLKLNDQTVTSNVLSIKQGGVMSYDKLSDIINDFKTSGQETMAIGNKVIKAIVTSSSDLDNLTSAKSMYVQDDATGINIFCDANHSLKCGDEVRIDLSGASITKYAGAPEITGVDPSKALAVLSSDNVVTPEEISVSDMTSGEYEAVYVRINDVQVVEADLSKTWVVDSKHTSINVENKAGATFEVRSSKYSKYGSQTVAQGSGYICGICTTYNGNAQLIFSKNSDFANMTGERFKKEAARLTVAEAIAQASGNAIVEARVIFVAPKGFVINDGGTQNLYVYTESAPTVSEDDIVKVTGTLTTYGKVVEFKESGLTVEPSQADIPETPAQTPRVLSGPEVASYTGDGSSELVSFGGTLVVSGNYYNVTLDGTSSVVGSLSTSMNLKDYSGLVINTVGYFTGFSGNNNMYFNVVTDDVEPSSDPYLNISPSGTTDVSASSTSLDISVASNQSWTVESDNPSFTLSTDSGDEDGTVTVSYPANKDKENVKVATITFTAGDIVKSLTITQAKYVDVSGARFEKVTGTPSSWDGEYLLVNEDFSIAVDGSLTVGTADGCLGKVGTGKSVTISSNVISTNVEQLLACTVVIASSGDGYTVKAKSGLYFQEADKDNGKIKAGLKGSETPVVNYIQKSGDYYYIYSGSKDTVFMLNKSSKTCTDTSKMFFRFYNKSNVGADQYKPLAFYKLVSE